MVFGIFPLLAEKFQPSWIWPFCPFLGNPLGPAASQLDPLVNPHPPRGQAALFLRTPQEGGPAGRLENPCPQPCNPHPLFIAAPVFFPLLAVLGASLSVPRWSALVGTLRRLPRAVQPTRTEAFNSVRPGFLPVFRCTSDAVRTGALAMGHRGRTCKQMGVLFICCVSSR